MSNTGLRRNPSANDQYEGDMKQAVKEAQHKTGNRDFVEEHKGLPMDPSHHGTQSPARKPKKMKG